MSLAAVSGFLALIGGAMLVWNVSRKFAFWAFLFAGFGISGGLDRVVTAVAGFIVGKGSDLTGALFGARLGFGVVAVAAIYLFSRRAKGGFLASAVAVMFATMLNAVGGHAIVAAVQDILAGIGSWFAALI